jgi:predicted nucleic acid-binding Zn ribbon protein
MSRPAPRPFSRALQALTDDLAPASALARVHGAWEPAVGATVAAVCRPTAERDGVLTVVCSEAVWAQELELMGEAIVERLNGSLGGPLLKRLRCRAG